MQDTLMFQCFTGNDYSGYAAESLDQDWDHFDVGLPNRPRDDDFKTFTFEPNTHVRMLYTCDKNTRYYSTQQTKLFDYLLKHFLIQSNRFEDIVNFIIEHEAHEEIIKDYADQAAYFMCYSSTRLDLIRDRDDKDDHLYLTFCINDNADSIADQFNAFIDGFLINRDPLKDKISVTVEPK